MAVLLFIAYYIIRLFKISFLNKLKINNSVISGISFLMLMVPLLMITFGNPYDLAIKMNNSYISYSSYEKNEQTSRYYQLKFRTMHQKDSYLYFDENKDMYTFFFDDGYKLEMSLE